MTSKKNKLFLCISEYTYTHAITHIFIKVAKRSNLIKTNRMRIGERKNVRPSPGIEL